MGDGNADGHLDVRILGPLEVRRAEAVLPLGGHRQQAVLACLVVSKGGTSTDRIAAAIWGDRPPPGYLTTLQTYVYRLREALEPTRAKGTPAQLLITTVGGYRLVVSDDDVDARRFERLVAEGRRLVLADPERASVVLGEALSLWRDDALCDFTDLEPVSREVARLDELRQAALESWAAAELALGRHAALAPQLGSLVAAYPMREGLHAHRMLALYRDGRQAEALAAYRQLRSTLAEELGIEPSSPLQQLHERILRHDPALDWKATSESRSASSGGGSASVVTEVATQFATERAEPTTPAGPLMARMRRRRWVAITAVTVAALALLTGTAVRVNTADDVVPVPPNAVAMLSRNGLDGDPVRLPESAVALLEGAGSLWALDGTRNTLLRIDPHTRLVIQTIPDVGGSPQSLAVEGNDVWVAGYEEGVLARVNTQLNAVVAKIPVGIQPSAVVAAGGQVWVANSGDNTVQRIDPHTGKAGRPISVGTGPAGLALDGTTLWVANSRGASVTTLDTRTGERLSADISVGAGPRGITVTESDVWVADELGQSVTRINRETGRPTPIPVEDGPSSVVVLDGYAWVNNAASGSVSRIDTATNSVNRIYLSSAPRALALVGGRIWVSTGAFASVDHVGGTLVYTTAPSLLGKTLDPAYAYAITALAILRPVYDGLVAFRVTEGLASQTLVPDLATSIPTPSDGGKTYVFTIRPGIRYWTGQEVVASDFVRGLRRALNGGNPAFFSTVVGAQNCVDAPTEPDRCLLSEGVSADDRTHRLTIRLSHPDPDFVYRLAYFVKPAPPGTPLTNSQMAVAVPGTGPYQVSQPAPDGSFTLTPNPYFHQWSFAAQPAAYPEQIHYQVAPSPDQGIEDVINGRADVIIGLGPSDEASLAGHAQLIWRFAAPSMDWAYLNSAVPPFNDVRARQAINYAVDRRAFTSLFAGSSAPDISCQMLPPGFPAYHRYCPYQTGPPSGDYLGPDLERAKQLVRESRTANVPITVRAFHWKAHSVSVYDAFPGYLADVLRSIGYQNVAVQDIPDDHVEDPSNDPEYGKYQIFTQFGWTADYPGPQTFYDLFSCASANMSHSCNPTIDAVAQAAAANAAIDPGRSLELWSQVDQMLTDSGAFVTLGAGARGAVLVSPTVRHVELSPLLGPVLSQFWVK